MTTLLEVEQIETHIGQYHILQGVSFKAEKGKVTVLLGRNGAGKTTTLRSLMGLAPISAGSITFKGEAIHRLPTYEIARKGIGYVPEDQGMFPDLTVEENLRLAMRRTDRAALDRRDWIVDLFPDLKTFWKKPSGLLSGGQKQMLAIARACVNDNELLLIDEPSKGLAPIMVERVMGVIREMKDHVTVVLVEQNFHMASTIGDCYYILDSGRTVHSGRMEELKANDRMKKEYLGIA